MTFSYLFSIIKVMKKYFKHRIESLVTISKIITVFYFEFRKYFKSSGESHDFWEMVYVDKGNMLCTADGKEMLLEEGEVIFHKPNEHHIHGADTQNPNSLFIISFETKSPAIRALEGVRLKIGRDLSKYIYMMLDNASSTFDMKYQNTEMVKVPLKQKPILGGLQAVKNLLEVFLIGVMRELDAQSDDTPSFVLKEDFDEFVSKQVIEYLSKNIRRRITVEELCESLNYTRSYLFRQFKSVTGKSIMSYFTELKIKEAKKLLRDTEMSVTAIAQDLAFDTPNYFTKTFKRLTGYTPLEYKKMRRMQNR